MKLLKRAILFPVLFLSAIFVNGQVDSLILGCPLANGVPRIIRSSDKDYQRSSEYGVMLTSKTDTLVQAVYDASVVIVTRTEDAKYDVVLKYRGYYFWYAGVLSPAVKQGKKVNKGDILGTYKPGDLLELLMFDKEEPVNPRKFLKCN
ncbi:MAG TPA: M23 family metallopeptidase [Chitinophagaceae bacterium]|nr:M23 family metallopeptidase [Chitinophagaceae bacterium]